jgi:hypothetical protein
MNFLTFKRKNMNKLILESNITSRLLPNIVQNFDLIYVLKIFLFIYLFYLKLIFLIFSDHFNRLMLKIKLL